jgi:hypothetical protein
MLESIGWIAAHRFLFSELRAHLLGWPPFLAGWEKDHLLVFCI